MVSDASSRPRESQQIPRHLPRRPEVLLGLAVLVAGVISGKNSDGRSGRATAFLGHYRTGIRCDGFVHCDVANAGYLRGVRCFSRRNFMRFVQGLYFIHKSPILKQHGCLTSHVCLVSDRWQVKIQEYGLSAFKAVQMRQKKDKCKWETISQDCQNHRTREVNVLPFVLANLWVAPEILRARENLVGTRCADIYSYAIICSELITRKPAYNLGENVHNLERKSKH